MMPDGVDSDCGACGADSAGTREEPAGSERPGAAADANTHTSYIYTYTGEYVYLSIRM